MSRPTILLDSNVWRYLVDADAIEALRRRARSSGVAIVACPAVAYEGLRVGDPHLRRALTRAITMNVWTRPMPEAYQECEEVRREVTRLRPDWLIRNPDLKTWVLLRSDWQQGWWRRARADPDSEARAIERLGSEDLSLAREEASQFRDRANRQGLTFHNISIPSAFAMMVEPTPGWDGRPFEEWRAHSFTVWTRGLLQPGSSTYKEWLAPWLDLTAIRKDESSWLAFWTRDVSTELMPLQWLRWSLQYVQSTRKTTGGTPVDNQISTYLPGCDYFLSSDVAFIDCIDRVRAHSPVPLAHGVKVQADATAILDAIAEIGEIRITG